MFKRILCKPQTIQLVALVSENYVPDKDRVTRLLRFGADPWAADGKGRGVLSYIISRAPTRECVDAWLDAAGDLSKAPWLKRKMEHPITTAIEDCSQTDLFRQYVIDQILSRNPSFAGLDSPGLSVMERIGMRFEQTSCQMHLFQRLAEIDPSLLLSPAAQAFMSERHHPSVEELFKTLGPQVEAAKLAEQTPQAPAAHRPRRRI